MKTIIAAATIVTFLLTCACSTPASTVGDGFGGGADSGPGRKPNILLIVADDLGYNDLAINNDNKEIDTPHMDQIARDGVRFTRHYAAAVCSPARAALLTGIYPERLGFLPNGRGIPTELVTLPERLQEEGYNTWHIGKWHIGNLERTAWPDHQGFDHWFGFLNPAHLAGKKHKRGRAKTAPPQYENPWLDSDEGAGEIYPGHLEDILTDKTIEVLSRENEKKAPWFVNLWFFAPHAPITPGREFAKKYPDTPAGRYQALVNQLDHNIGRIISHLEDIGALNNTIIVIVSDNGGTNQQLNNNAPYIGVKTTLTEGGLRTPLIIKWPGDSINGRVYTDTVTIEDIYPTLLASAGLAPEAGLDGISFFHGVQHQEPALHKPLYWDHMPESYAGVSADGRWRLYRAFPYFGEESTVGLYDFNQDPTASREVIPAPAVPLTQMTADYLDWYKDVHTVATEYSPTENGSGVLSGMGYLRTPGFGPFTVGVGISDNFSGRIVTQGDIWELSRSGDAVNARFGDTVLAGEIENANQCHSIVISGDFYRRTDFTLKRDTINLTLYIDGVKAQSVETMASLRVDDLTVETVVGDPDNPDQPGSISPPIILKAILDSTTPWTVEAFSRDLCSRP